MVFGPVLAARDPLVKAVATLGLTLILLGLMDLLWPSSGGESRSISLPTDNSGFMVGGVQVNWTDVIGLARRRRDDRRRRRVFLRCTKLGTAMRAMANDREITATLGVPVRRVEAAAWFGCGMLAGIAGVLLADLVALDPTTLTFLVISSLAAALIARLQSITARLPRGDRDRRRRLDADADPVTHQLPRHDAVRARRGRAAMGQPPARDQHDPPGSVSPMANVERDGCARAAAQTATTGPATGVRGLLPATRRDQFRVARIVVSCCCSCCCALPSLFSVYYIDASTQVAIYSIVALGLGLLVGRVGHGLARPGRGAVARRLGGGQAAVRDLAAVRGRPAGLTGLITMVLGTLVGLPALRLSGLYLALITLMLAGAITVVLATTNFPNGGHGFLGYNGARAAHPADPPARDRTDRPGVLPLLGRRRGR